MIEPGERLSGRPIEPGASFHFQCGPDLACFNTCCRNKRLLLLPYDVIRLCRALDLPSSRLLAEHVELEMDPGSGWPTLRLRLDGEGRCPFVGREGCAVYRHRPMVCRAHPITWAVRLGPDGAPEEKYLGERHGGCLGWGQAREHTLESWVADQGLAPYQAAGRELLPLWFHPARKGRMDLTQQQIHAVIAALYNLEVFAQAAAKPGFGRDCGLKPERVQAALKDPEALLLVGRDFLLARLFGQARGRR